MPTFDSNGRGRRTSPEDMDSGARKHFGKEIEKRLSQQKRMEKKGRRGAPPRYTHPLCDTCNHAFRDFIEFQLVRGIPYKTLGERVSPPVDRRSLSNHYQNHMDLEDAALRAIIEREAALQGQNHDEGVADLVTTRSVMEIALRKGYEDVIEGNTTVEPRDLIQIAKLLGDMNDKQYSTGLEELRQQMAIFVQAIKDVLSLEDQARIAERLKVLRKRENMISPIENQMQQIESVPALPDAEVIED